MLYKAKGNSGYELEVDERKLFIKSANESQCDIYRIHEVAVEDFKMSSSDNGSMKILVGGRETTREYLIPFNNEQQRDIFQVANCITFSKFRPKNGNPSFAIGIGGSLEVNDDKLLISRDANQSICTWARKHKNVDLNFGDVHRIGFYAVGTLREDILPEVGNIGCIRFATESKEHMEWNPLTDENTILFDESVEKSFFRFFRLVKKLSGSPTIRIREDDLRYFSDWIKSEAGNYIDQRQMTKNKYCNDVWKLQRKGYVSIDDACTLENGYSVELQFVGLLSAMREIKDKEYEELLRSHRRGLIIEEEWNSLELDYLRGYSKNEAWRRLRAKENTDMKASFEKLGERGLLKGTEDEELTELIAKSTKTTHKKGKLIHFPTRRW